MISFYTSNRKITVRNQARVSGYPKALWFCRFLATQNRDLPPTGPTDSTTVLNINNSVVFQFHCLLKISLDIYNTN
jgi:hypothetical protein